MQGRDSTHEQDLRRPRDPDGGRERGSPPAPGASLDPDRPRQVDQGAGAERQDLPAEGQEGGNGARLRVPGGDRIRGAGLRRERAPHGQGDPGAGLPDERGRHPRQPRGAGRDARGHGQAGEGPGRPPDRRRPG